MEPPPEGPEHYLAARLNEVLAHDLGELDVQVTLASGKVFLTGHVPTTDRRDAITLVAIQTLPGHEIMNEITVRSLEETGEIERLS